MMKVMALLAALAGATACSGAPRPAQVTGPSPLARAEQEQARLARELGTLRQARLAWPDEQGAFIDAARAAWNFANGQWEPATGLMRPVGRYPYTTIWDVGSMLSAIYAARGLGFIDEATYDRRVATILATLKRIPLYDGVMFNKNYDTRNGAMAGRIRSGDGTGWSTTDLGRLLIWLKIVGTGGHEQAARDVVARNDFARAIRDGYLWGQDLDLKGKPRNYQEGKIGYEQYAAHGFALWGFRADKALDFAENALPVPIMGQELPADYRRGDRLNSEPFLLLGLELGWDAPTARLVSRLLRAQEARANQIGAVTITGEDAIDVPPHYFYYYCILANGREFSVDVQDASAVVEGPRWVSAKSAFAFHALMPSRYTDRAVQTLAAARSGGGWASGVYETGGGSTGTINLNTAAVILSAALVHARGLPLIEQAHMDTDS